MPKIKVQGEMEVKGEILTTDKDLASSYEILGLLLHLITDICWLIVGSQTAQKEFECKQTQLE